MPFSWFNLLILLWGMFQLQTPRLISAILSQLFRSETLHFRISLWFLRHLHRRVSIAKYYFDRTSEYLQCQSALTMGQLEPVNDLHSGWSDLEELSALTHVCRRSVFSVSREPDIDSNIKAWRTELNLHGESDCLQELRLPRPYLNTRWCKPLIKQCFHRTHGCPCAFSSALCASELQFHG